MAVSTAPQWRQKPIPKEKTQKAKKQKEKEEKEFVDDDIEEAFEVKCILKENQLHYKVRWLGYDMTHDSWVRKEEIEETAPEVLATYRNTLANAAKRVLHPRQWWH